MSVTTWLIVCSTVVTALATSVIAVNAFITYRFMGKTERERSDLYRAMVASNLLCSPQGDNARLYDFAKQMFRKDYTGTTEVLREETGK